MHDQKLLIDFTQDLNLNEVEIVKKLAEVASSVDKRLTSDIKWRRLTFALEGDFHHWICGIDITKKSVNLVFHFGGLLDDPDKILIAGTSKFLRKLEFKSIDEIKEERVKVFITQAIQKLPYFKENWRALNK